MTVSIPAVDVAIGIAIGIDQVPRSTSTSCTPIVSALWNTGCDVRSACYAWPKREAHASASTERFTINFN
jgi:hypothetical protein